MKPQPVSLLSQKIRKKYRHFSSVSRETDHKKKVRFLAKTDDKKKKNPVSFLKPFVVSLKPGFFGGVGGLTPGCARGPERSANKKI